MIPTMEDVLSRVRGVKQTSSGWVAHCPAHADERPSLSIGVNASGKLLLCCHAGCSYEAIVAALGLIASATNHTNTRQPIATYDYTDETGQLIYRVLRYDPKDFRLQRPDGRGGWLWNLHGVQRLPYRLPALRRAAVAGEVIYYVEGEKDAESARMIGLTATTFAGGVKAPFPADFTKHFHGVSDIVLLPDNDEPGREYIGRVANHLTAAGLPCRILVLPDLGPKGDLTDWLAAGGTLEQLQHLVQATPWYETTPNAGGSATSRTSTEALGMTYVGDRVASEDAAAWATLPTPPTLAPRALYGPVGEWISLIEPHTEASPPALLVSALVALGALIGRTPSLPLDGTRHGVNLFALLIGPTATGRKGTAWGRVRHLLRALDPEFAARNVAAGLSSGQGLINAIRDAAPQTPGQLGGNLGVMDKRLLAAEPEFAAALRQMTRDGNILSPILREAWDGHTLRTLTKGDPLVATDPHVAILAQITPEELRRALGEVETFNGFLNRFLLVWTERARLLPFDSAPAEADEQIVIERLGRAVNDARTISMVGLTAAGVEWWRDHYAQLTTGLSGRLGAATQRAAPQVRRLAALYTVLDGQHLVDVPQLEAALALWEYCASSAAFILGGAADLSIRGQRLVTALLNAGPAGLSRSDIRREVFASNNVPAAEIVAVLRELQEAGLARMAPSPGSSGRPAERWVHVTHLHHTPPMGSGKNGSNGKNPQEEQQDSSHASHNSHFPTASVSQSSQRDTQEQKAPTPSLPSDQSAVALRPTSPAYGCPTCSRRFFIDPSDLTQSGDERCFLCRRGIPSPATTPVVPATPPTQNDRSVPTDQPEVA